MPGLNHSASPGMRPPYDNASLFVWLDRQRIVVPSGDNGAPTKIQIELDGDSAGDPNHVHRDIYWYPFVSLHFELWFLAFWSNDNGKTSLGLPLPLSLTLYYNHVPMYQMSHVSCTGGDNATSEVWTALFGDIGINSMYRRCAIGALFVLTWALAVACFSLSIVWAVTEHLELHYDLLCFCGSLLFALPGMRAMLPAAPAAGLWYDLINIQAQLWLISIGIIIQFVRIIADHAFRNNNNTAGKNATCSCTCTCACAKTAAGPSNHSCAWMLISIGIIIQFVRIIADHAFRNNNNTAGKNATCSCTCTCACAKTAAGPSSDDACAMIEDSPPCKAAATGAQGASPADGTSPSPPLTPAGMPGALPGPASAAASSVSAAPAPIAVEIPPVHAHGTV